MIKESVESLIMQGVKLHRLDAYTDSPKETTELRKKIIEKKTNVTLDSIGSYDFDDGQAAQKNIENMIGATQIPLGITAPLKVNGNYANGEYYLPMATTEKSLVAGTSRGCKALTLSGGVNVTVTRDGITRAPLFKVPSVQYAITIQKWLKENEELLHQKTAEQSVHSKLKSFRSWLVGRNLFIRFEFFTGDAMGMNTVTRISDNLCRLIINHFPEAEWISISGNMCIDKKPAAINFIEGRGKSVIAECTLPADIVSSVLKTSVEEIVDVCYRKNLIGSAQAGSYGFNAHFANIVAAIFAATGQDIAQVVSASMGFSLFEKANGNPPALHASVTIPVLQVATVGGGTRLASQKNALSLLGCSGGGNPPGSNSLKLAEIIAAAVLAGEVSLMASQEEHSLARAHML